MRKTGKIQTLIDSVCSGDFSSSDIEILFINLRKDFFDEPILYDLSNFVSHGDERNRGASFDYVHSYVKNFINVSEKGGTVYGRDSVFQSDSVMKLLIQKLKSLDFKFNENQFICQKEKIIDSLKELMDDTDFKIEDPRVIRCYIRKDKNRVIFCMNLNLNGPVIKTSPNATIVSNLFD
jgi:hypothetical protein